VKNMNNVKAFATSALIAAGTLALGAMNFVAHAQEVTIDPTQQANLNLALKSIPDTATAQVLAIFPVVLPYILLLVAIGIGLFIIRLLMHHRT